jgi:hypothetical protein
MAWAEERALVMTGHPGTRAWTEAQLAELESTGKVRGFEGHHIDIVKGYEAKAGDPNNIDFLTRKEHLEAHGGNFRNPTDGEGKAFDREGMIREQLSAD